MKELRQVKSYKRFDLENGNFHDSTDFPSAHSKFWFVRDGGDKSIQFINFGRVGDKRFKEWRQKIRGWKGG